MMSHELQAPDGLISPFFSRDSKWIVFGGELWNTEGKNPFTELQSLPDLQGRVCFACSADGQWLAAGDDQGARMWDLTAKNFAVTSPAWLERETGVTCL